MNRSRLGFLLVCLGALGAAAPPTPTPSAARPDPAALGPTPGVAEATSLLGEPLVPASLAPDLRAKLEDDLAAAFTRWQQAPEDPDRIIWVGRRLAYLSRYREAIEYFSSGAAKFPSDPRFLRHRGHRYITTRRLDLAEADLARAAEMIRALPDEVEPDGQPNARNIPTSTLHTNVWYHLGLARYLKAEFAGAAEAYRAGLAASKNPDMDVAMRYWLYHALARSERRDEARALLQPVQGKLEVIENREYLRLLLLYKGEGKAESLLQEASKPGSDAVSIGTAGYGIAAWFVEQGREKEALPILRRVLQESSWASFGRIAAEAEIARMRRKP